VAERKIIFFELNEVPYRVLDDVAARHPDGALAKVLARGQQFETIAADSGQLFPTKTWPTLHRGVGNERHGITNFGQDLKEIDRAYPSIWQLLADRGLKVGVCGSLFSFPMPKSLDNYAFYMPDAFASTSEAHPAALEAFQRFNLSMSRASSRNVSRGIDFTNAMKLVPHLGQLGFSAATAAGVAKQLMAEWRDPHKKGRRRSFQSILGFDIFYRQLVMKEPDFCTFFTNHVAATMHRFWAAAYPKDYDRFGLGDDWVAANRDEIDFAMQQTDAMLAKLTKFVERHPEYKLMIATSMGQAAVSAEPVTSCVGIKDMRRFLAHFGLEAKDFEERPAMAPIFNIVVPEPEKQRVLRTALGTMSVGGIRFGKELYTGFFEFAFGPLQNYQGPSTVTLGNAPLSFDEMGFGNVPHEDGVYLTADHIPEGALIVYDVQQAAPVRQRTQMSTLDIAPAILKNFSLSRPSYMGHA
jgi:hypothetical protein